MRISRPVSIMTALGLTVLLLAAQIPARELAVPAEDLVAAELGMVGVEPMSGTPVVVLRAPESGRVVPIFIGVSEAQAILLAQRNVATPRPMTHDLTAALIESMGGVLKRVIVDELRNGTYYGALELEIAGRGGTVRVDTRPSDGLALAVRTGAEIWVAPAVLEAAENIPFEGLGDGEVVTALGVTVVEASDDLRQALQLPDDTGVLVSDSRGMAAISGLRPGALILKVNDRSVTSPSGFLEAIGEIPRDGTAKIRYWHEGQEKEASLPVDVPQTTPRDQRRGRI